MHFIKILQTRCVNIVNSKFNIGKLRFLDHINCLMTFEIMNEDSYKLCSNNSSCDEIVIIDTSLSSKQAEEDHIHDKNKALIVDEVEEIYNSFSDKNTSKFFTVDMSPSHKIKVAQHNEGRRSEIVNSADVEKIFNISSCSSSKDFNKANEHKSHLLRKCYKSSSFEIIEASKKKISRYSSINKNSSVVIDMYDECEESILLESKVNIKQKQSELGLSSNKVKCADNSFNDFMIIDTLPSPSLIDIDHPYKYKNFSKFRKMNTPETYNRYEGSKSNVKTKISNAKFIPVIDIDDDDDDDNQDSNGNKNDCRNKEKLGSYQQLINSGSANDTNLLACSCSIESSSSVKCKNICSRDSRDEKNKGNTKENSCMEKHLKKKKKSKKHSKDEKDSKIHKNKHRKSKKESSKRKKSTRSLTGTTDMYKDKCSDDDIIFEASVCKINHPDISNETAFFRKHLLKSALIYQKRKYSTSETHDSRRKIPRKNKYKEVEGCVPSSSDNDEFSCNEIATSSADTTKNKPIADVSRSTSSLDSHSTDQDNTTYAKRKKKISSILSHSEPNSDRSVVIEYSDSDSSDSVNFVDRYLDLTFNNKTSTSPTDDKKSDKFSCSAININKADVNSSNILLDEIPLPSEIQQNCTSVYPSDDDLGTCSNELKEIDEASNASIQSSYSFLLNDTFENYEASCMDIDSDESNDEVIESDESNDEVVESGESNDEVIESGESNDEVVESEESNDEVVESDELNDEVIESGESNDEIVVDVENKDFVPLEAIKLSNLEMYPPISDDIKNKRQKLESLRKWELTGLGQEMINYSKNANGTLFTLLSYNVLSQKLLWDNKELYENCNRKYLEWSYRWSLFQHEVRHLQPDIITLQEVEGSHYHTHFLPWFKHLGYNCVFKKKTRDKVDGCAIIYNAKKFELIEENSVEFYQPKGEKVLDRDNIGLIVRLTPTSFSSPFCVATTHILFNPRRIDVKLAQMAVFLAELDRICYITEENGLPKYCPTILTGDFNSEPYSPLLYFVKQGTLKYVGMQRIKNSNKLFGRELIPPLLGLSDYCQHKVLHNGRYLEKKRGALFSLNDKRKIEEELIKLSHDRSVKSKTKCFSNTSSIDLGCSSGHLHHAFNFKSVHYHKLYRLNKAPEVTTFQDYWTTVDYIFYTKLKKNTQYVEGPLKLIGRYGLLGASEARALGPLPSDICPSDHFPLAAQFLLKDTT